MIPPLRGKSQVLLLIDKPKLVPLLCTSGTALCSSFVSLLRLATHTLYRPYRSRAIAHRALPADAAPTFQRTDDVIVPVWVKVFATTEAEVQLFDAG